MAGEMRLRLKSWAFAVLLALPPASYAASCTTQAELPVTDRSALTAAGGRLAEAVLQQDYTGLQSALLPEEAQEWGGIREAVEQAAPLVKGGQAQLQNLYLLDATMLTSPQDTQFFCSNATGSLTVTITMRTLPPGRYAVVLADAAGAPLGGQMGLILAWDAANSSAGWKLAGLSVRQGIFDGHDGVWYWSHARDLAKSDQPWSAWFSYEVARLLLLPVDAAQKVDHLQVKVVGDNGLTVNTDGGQELEAHDYVNDSGPLITDGQHLTAGWVARIPVTLDPAKPWDIGGNRYPLTVTATYNVPQDEHARTFNARGAVEAQVPNAMTHFGSIICS